jgi:hypothetical protein
MAGFPDRPSKDSRREQMDRGSASKEMIKPLEADALFDEWIGNGYGPGILMRWQALLRRGDGQMAANGWPRR